MDVRGFAVEMLCRALKFRGVLPRIAGAKDDVGSGGYTPDDPARDRPAWVSDVTTPESEGINSKIVVVDPSKGRGFRRAALHADKLETITISQALNLVTFFLQLSNLFSDALVG